MTKVIKVLTDVTQFIGKYVISPQYLVYPISMKSQDIDLPAVCLSVHS